MTSRTVVLPAERSSATPRITISRSVTMPTSMSFSPTRKGAEIVGPHFPGGNRYEERPLFTCYAL
ncbi:hypothetical protein NKI67_28090 [Mesorhizobium sp. M0408]